MEQNQGKSGLPDNSPGAQENRHEAPAGDNVRNEKGWLRSRLRSRRMPFILMWTGVVLLAFISLPVALIIGGGVLYLQRKSWRDSA